MAAADAFAAKGASDIDARQMQATLRSLVADAVNNSTAQSASSPPANAQQAMLRYALARHGGLSNSHPSMTPFTHFATLPILPNAAQCCSQHVSTFPKQLTTAAKSVCSWYDLVVCTKIISSAGEVAIDLQRVGNHCKDIAAELHKVKADIKERTPPSTTLQLKQRNAALSHQLEQTAARYAAGIAVACKASACPRLDYSQVSRRHLHTFKRPFGTATCVCNSLSCIAVR